jgi:hypothetical protein
LLRTDAATPVVPPALDCSFVALELVCHEPRALEVCAPLADRI